MEKLLSYQPVLGNVLQDVLFLLCLVLVIMLAIYNWLYLLRILKTNDQIGLRPPEHVCELVRTTIFLPVCTAVFIIAFLITGLVDH